MGWKEIQSDPEYQSLSLDDRAAVRLEFFHESIGKTKEFMDLSEDDKIVVLNEFEREANEPQEQPEEIPYSAGRFADQFKEGVKDVARQTTIGATIPMQQTLRGQQELGSEMRTFAQKSGTVPQQEGPPEDIYQGQAKGVSDLSNISSSEALKQDPKYLESAGFWEDVVRIGPQVLSQIGVGVATGGVGSTVMMGHQIAGSTYEQAIKDGADPDRAARAGAANAIMQAPLEAIGLNKTLKLFKTRTALVDKLKKTAGALGTEWLTEFLQAYPDAASKIWSADADETVLSTVGKVIDDAANIAKQGAKEGLTVLPFAALGASPSLAMRGKPESKPNFSDRIKSDLDSGNTSVAELQELSKTAPPEIQQEIASVVEAYTKKEAEAAKQDPKDQTDPNRLAKEILAQMGYIPRGRPSTAKEAAEVLQPSMFEQAKSAQESAQVFERAGLTEDPVVRAQHERQSIIDRTNIDAENELQRNEIARQQLAKEAELRKPQIDEIALTTGPPSVAPPPPPPGVGASPINYEANLTPEQKASVSKIPTETRRALQEEAAKHDASLIGFANGKYWLHDNQTLSSGNLVGSVEEIGPKLAENRAAFEATRQEIKSRPKKQRSEKAIQEQIVTDQPVGNELETGPTAPAPLSSPLEGSPKAPVQADVPSAQTVTKSSETATSAKFTPDMFSDTDTVKLKRVMKGKTVSVTSPAKEAVQELSDNKTTMQRLKDMIECIS